MVNLKDIVARGGYLVDGATGEKVIFYDCDPAKNTVCDKQICRAALSKLTHGQPSERCFVQSDGRLERRSTAQ